MASPSTADIVIVGAGLAGTTAAGRLARQGFRVVLIDPYREYPACFKAEKIEADQLDYLEKFGLLDTLLPHAGQIQEVLDAKDGRVMEVLRLRQLGVRYHEMVNLVRGCLPAEVDFRVGRVRSLSAGPELQTVTLADGTEAVGRLVLLASGTGGDLGARAGFVRRMIQKEQSVSFGFDIARADGRDFPFQSVTYYPDGSRSRIGYLTLFLIRNTMRVNLFTFWPQREERSRSLMQEPKAVLRQSLPRLLRLIGDIEVISRVETARVDLYQVEPRPIAGVLPIADAYQSVCPTTGSGVSKVLTDVDVLCHELAPEWLATPGMGAEKIAGWYAHPRKRAEDEKSLRRAQYRRFVSLDGSLRSRLHRARVYSTMWLRGWPAAFRLTRKLTA